MPTRRQENLRQGEGGAHSSKASGSHTDPTGPTGAFKKGASGSHLEQGTTTGAAGAASNSGSHLTPHPSLTDKTAVRGGGDRRGHDRTNPRAGKSKSGSKFAQHPNNRFPKR